MVSPKQALTTLLHWITRHGDIEPQQFCNRSARFCWETVANRTEPCIPSGKPLSVLVV